MKTENLKHWIAKFRSVTPRDISVIVGSYNQVRSLPLVFESLRRQTVMPDEIIVADDGSGSETMNLLEEIQDGFPVEVRIVRHEDTDYRYGEIRNKAFREATGDLVIILDGDVLPNPGLVEVYRDHYQPHWFAVGALVRLSKQESREIIEEGLTDETFEKYLTAGRKFSMMKTYLKNKFYCLIGHPRKPRMYGGNFAVDSGLYYGAGGFDEAYTGLSSADVDFRNRMNLLGADAQTLWYPAYALHLHHDVEPDRHTDTSSRKSGRKEGLYDRRKGEHWPLRGLRIQESKENSGES